MPTFDGKTGKFEMFENFFQTSVKIHNQLKEEDKTTYLFFFISGNAPQTFKNSSSLSSEILGEVLNVLRRIYVKPRSIPAAKHNFQRLFFNPANQKLFNFLDGL